MHRTTGRSGEGGDARAGPYVFDLLGPVRLSVPDGSEVPPLGRKARGLLAYLALDGHDAVPRERLMALLWSERGEEQARASLRQCLHELRPLAGGEAPPLAVDRHHVALERTRIETDIDRFQALVARHDASALAAGLDRFTRPLAEDLDDLDPAFDAWLAVERTRLEDRHVGQLSAVLRYALEAGALEPARDLAMALQARHPTNEEAARLAMTASHALGERDAVRRIHQRLETALRRELDEVPSPETTRHLERLLKGPMPLAGRSPAPGPVAAAPAERRRPIGRPAILAAGAALAVLMTAGAVLLQRRAPSAVPGDLILVRRLQVPPNDTAAETLRQGLAASLARAVVGKDAALRIVDDGHADEGGGRPAQFVLDGEARTSGIELRATVSLRSARSHEILWSGNFSRLALEAEALRQQAAVQIANALTCAFSARYRSGTALADGTIRIYLTACDAIARQDFEGALKQLRQVIAAAPDFSRAWADLATSSSYAAMDLDGASAEAMQQEARAQADRALELDPHDGKAYYARAMTYPGLDHWLDRVAVLRAGLAVDPACAELNSALAEDLGSVGRQHEAVGYARRSVALDPLSSAKTANLVSMLAYDGRTGEALAILAEADRLWPRNPDLWGARLSISARYGDPEAALAMLRDPQRASWMGRTNIAVWERVMIALQSHDERDVATAVEAIRERAKSVDGVGDVQLMHQLAVLGRLDDAFGLASRHGGTIPDGETIWFRSYMAAFRADPRFMPLAYRQGVIGIWVKSGVWPDFCVEKTVPYDCEAEARRLMTQEHRTENLPAAR